MRAIFPCPELGVIVPFGLTSRPAIIRLPHPGCNPNVISAVTNGELRNHRRRPARVAVHLLGQISLDRCLALQKRLIYEASCRADGRITLLICEHPPIVTIGRGGSRDDIQLRAVQLAGQTIDIYSVNRGGGAMFHLPGQLAVYPIVPLACQGWTVGEFLDRFQAGLQLALGQLDLKPHARPSRYGLWGVSGQLVSIGVAVTDWITYFGGWIHVAPPLPVLRYVVTDPIERIAAGSLSEERRQPLRMAHVRSRVARAVSEAFDCPEYLLYTGHPLLAGHASLRREASRAS